MARNVTIEYERDGRQFEHTFVGPIRIIELPNGEMRLEDPSGKPLCGYAGDGIYLGTDLPTTRSKRNEQFYFPKVFHEDSRGLRRVALENSPRPYAGLADDAVLDTQDVARKAGCSPLTVLRHANAKRLKIHPKSSVSQFYYKKRDIDVWLENESEFRRGRPRKEH